MQSVVGVAMVPEAILEKLEPMNNNNNNHFHHHQLLHAGFLGVY